MSVPPSTTALTADVSPKPTLTTYGVVCFALSLWGVILKLAVGRSVGPATEGKLLSALYAQAALTGVVWLLMVGVRNYAILRDLIPAAYYADYRRSIPKDWVERPARAFNNLLQLPTLFYVVCLLMMQREAIDGGQVALAWLFVVARTVHAIVYIGWNHVPTRFAVWVMSSLALITLWVRLALS